jgi:hypothetical protein
MILQIAREVLDAAARVIRPGITTDEIDAVVHDATIAAGAVFYLFILALHHLQILVKFQDYHHITSLCIC